MEHKSFKCLNSEYSLEVSGWDDSDRTQFSIKNEFGDTVSQLIEIDQKQLRDLIYTLMLRDQTPIIKPTTGTYGGIDRSESAKLPECPCCMMRWVPSMGELKAGHHPNCPVGWEPVK